MQPIFIILTTLCLLVALVTIAYYVLLLNRPNARWLMENGKKIKADFVSFEIDLTVESKGKNPFIINCHWNDSANNMLYHFKSEFLWFNPGPLIKDLQSLDVYVKKTNPKKYFVDTSFLPENQIF